MRRILLATETCDLASDLLVLAAADRGVPVARLNLDRLGTDASMTWRDDRGLEIEIGGDRLAEEHVSGAWFRRLPNRDTDGDPAVRFAARETEAFLRGVFDTVSWPWMNRPSAAARAEQKLLQLREAKAVGLAIAPTLAGNDPAHVRAFAARHRTIAKTMAGSRVREAGTDQIVFTSAIEAADLACDLDVQACPTLYQERIETSADVRATIVDEQVFAARMTVADRTQADVDWRRVGSERLRYEPTALDSGTERASVALLRRLGLRFGCLDFVVTPRGETVFLEVNPAGQWGWIERAAGLPITDAILDGLAP